LRNQEKLIKKKKKSRSRFGRFVLALILIIIFLVLAFYFLNNPSAYAGLKNKITSIFTSGSTDKPGSPDSQVNAESIVGADNSGTASNTGTGVGNAEATDANGQSNAEATDANGNTIAASGQDNTGSVSGTIATDSSGNVSQSTDSQTASGSSAEEQATSKNQGTSGSIAGTAQSFWQKIIAFFRQKISGQADNFPGTINMKIYFAALGQDEVFSFEERLINAGSPRVAVENTVNELLKGPSKSFHYPVIPPGTKLLGVQIYENLAKIDLSQEFLENSLESGILDDYVIYTIVDTVTQVPGVEGVIFLIDGKRIKLYGSVDISIPVIKNEKYLPVETGETGGSSESSETGGSS
jgi:spore germination protein GerM